MKKSTIKENYEIAVNAYVDIFCKQCDLVFEYWVDYTGGIAVIGDYYFNFSDIKYHMDNDINKDLIFSWYDETLIRAAKSKTRHSYEYYLMGDGIQRQMKESNKKYGSKYFDTN